MPADHQIQQSIEECDKLDAIMRLLNALIMLGLPLLVAAALMRKHKLSWRLFFYGAIAFAVSQILEIPFNRYLLQPLVEMINGQPLAEASNLGMGGILFALSAGVFEESSRAIVYWVSLREYTRWKDAVLYGVGHGGLEAIFLGGIALYAFFQATAYRNIDLNNLVPLEQLQLARAQLDLYWSLPWYAALLGALERIFAMLIQVTLAVMVLQAFIRKKVHWFFLAIGWHTLVDAVVVIGIQTWDIYFVEFLIGLMALFSLAILWRLRSESDLPHAKVEVDDVEEMRTGLARRKRPFSLDQIERSRYDQNG